MNFPKNLIKGNIVLGERLGRHTSFRIGGPAAVWADPRDVKELKRIVIFAGENRIPTFVIGGGTNVLARDEGFNGIVIHLGSSTFKNIRTSGTTIRIGSGYSVPALVRLCCNEGLSGLESLIGIPGTVGGAVCMNAGGWSSPLYKNIGDYVTSLKVMDNKGKIETLKREALSFGYRYSNLSPYVILEADLKLIREESSALKSRCSKFLKMKRDKQVLDAPSAGCVFKNPKDFQFTTGQMIDMLGLKGLTLGGAQISRKHANFIINRGRASCEDVLKLVDIIRKKVMDNYNISLELEIKII
ncbi:MAG: UDP-N-acetylmuramate dehydrogenase [Candidatus Omnitrophica bacterium]|nr:UDP-N-acetylmuramate dehydrogenase [Candidatus Omnitrophota bacterium]